VTERRVKAPGLIWVKRKAGFTPYWIARESDRKAGFRPKSANLSRWANDPQKLAERCDALCAEVLAWRSARPGNPLQFDGTIQSLAALYHSHPQSRFQELRKPSRSLYLHYLRRMELEIGQRHVGEISGLDLKGWHQKWSNQGKYLAASKTCRSVLLAMVTFGIEARLPGCVELAATLRAANHTLPNPRRREAVVTADQVVALRAAAHADGRPSSALAYALVFETTLRLWDVIGQWQSTDKGPDFWHGLRWEHIGPDLLMHYTPSKTSANTGLAVTFPLVRAPMVMEEFAFLQITKSTWADTRLVGPVIIAERTRMPFRADRFREGWRHDREAAGLPSTVWARDLRASGITEGRAAGAATDDASKVAGHAGTKTTSAVYDRAALEAAERFADARVRLRKSRMA
jgi:integrase